MNATALTATNTANVFSNSALGQSQTINSGIINNIGAAATGALGVASVNQTFSQSSINQGGVALPGNQVSVGAISATNNTTGAVAPPASFNIEADVSITGFALIGTTFGGTGGGGGIGNSIGAAASAAVAQANITQSFDTNSPTDLTTLPANSVVTANITATNTAGSVLAAIGVQTAAQINNGVNNSISAQAIGASANASISTRQLDTNTAPAAGLATPATNTVTTGTLTATNNGAIVATGFNSGVGALINNGTGNTIGAVAFGASAGAGITQAVDFTTAAAGNTVALDTVYSNSVTSGSLTGPITATNNATGTVFATVGVPNSPSIPLTSSTIQNGIGNSISAQAVGASASNSVTQEFANVTTVLGPSGFNPANAATNTVITGAPLATNLANVTSILGSQGSTISAGIGNSISSSAVGASANVSVTQSVSGSTFTFSDRLGTNTAEMQSNQGAVATNGQSGPTVAAQIQATISEFGPSLISNGVGNSISASAVGASTSASINQSILGSTGDLTKLGSNAVIIADHGGAPPNGADATYNKGASPVTATFNQTGSAMISDGVGNSISAQAIGATASASISSRVDNTITPVAGSAAVQTNSVDTTAGTSAGWNDVFGSNTGVVTASFTATNNPSATITTGVANNIGAAAIGGAGSASINQVVAFDTANPANTVITLSLFGNTVTTGDVAGLNTGAINSSITIPGNTVIGTLNAPTGTYAGIGNSIAAQGIGASANSSISSRFYNVVDTTGAPATPATNVIHGTDVTANNTGATVTVSASIGTATSTAQINNGVSNFIGASAIGASASAGITQTVSAAIGAADSFNMTQLPSNTIIVNGTQSGVQAINTGNVIAGINNPGSTEIGIPGAPISSGVNAGNVGNSISTQAVGASAAASITTQVFNTTITSSAAAVAKNSVQFASLSSTNSGAVSSTGIFGTSGSATTLVSIGGGVGNSIGASAVGASSSASINQVVSTSAAASTLGTLPSNSITPAGGTTGSITAQNNAGGSITASLTTLGLTGTTIMGGVGNSISAGAVGASAGASIAQSIANVH